MLKLIYQGHFDLQFNIYNNKFLIISKTWVIFLELQDKYIELLFNLDTIFNLFKLNIYCKFY